MSTLILRAPTIEEQEAEDFDPIPCLAPAVDRVTVMPFQLGIPNGAGGYTATFCFGFESWVNECAVRYSENIPPTYIRLNNVVHLIPEDELRIHLHRGHRK